MNKAQPLRVLGTGVVACAASTVLAGCFMFNSSNIVDNIDAAAGVQDGEPGRVSMAVGDIFDSSYRRVIFICPGATEWDVDEASGGTWQGGSDDEDKWSPPSRGQVEIYRDVNEPGFSKYVTTQASQKDLDVCGTMGGVVAVLPTDEQVTFVRSEQDGPWVKQ